MAGTWEMDRAGAFVGRSVYHSWLGIGGFPVKKDKSRCDFNNHVSSHKHTRKNKCVLQLLLSVSAQNVPCVSVAIMPYGVSRWLHLQRVLCY